MNITQRLICCIAVLLLNSVCQAEPSFELPLKELKKPSLPPSAKKSKAAARQTAKTAETSAKPRKTASSTPQKAVKTAAAAPAVSAPAQPATPKIDEVTLKPGLACWFAGQTAGIVAAPVTAPELQKGFRLAPVAVAQHDEVTTLITCGLPDAEAYTIARLLAARNLQMLNINGTESSEQTVEKVLNSLGFSYQREQGEGAASFIVALDGTQEKLVRLVISP